MSALALRLYAGLMWLVQPLLRLKLARRAARESGYAQAVGERFGHYNQPVESRRELVWLHAVSLGETRTAAVLLKALRDAHPGLRVLLTHGTATGRAEGLGLLAPGDLQVWQPWDSPAAVARFLDHFKPRVGLLMETEVWPCLVAAADARAVPLLLVNARLSEKSLQQALRMGPLALPAFAALKQVYAQTADGAARFAQLGVVVAGVFGNLKFDAEPDAAQQAQGRAWRSVAAGPVLMFASSRDGEEAAFFNEIIALRQQIRARSAPFSIATDGRSQGADDLGSDLGSDLGNDLTEGLVVGGEEREAERVGSGFSAGLTTGADGRVDGRAPQRADGRVDGRVAAPVQAWPDADADGDAGSASPARARAQAVSPAHRPAPDAPRSTWPAIKLLIVPRHPHRFDAVEALALQHGLRVSRRSTWPDGPASSLEALQAEVWLGDSLGEMALYYTLADVALLGGSFEPLGGQNLIEAAACGCPIVMGPHTFNFSEAAALAEAEGAALRVGDLREGVGAAVGLINDAPGRRRAVDAGLGFAARHRGATGKTLAAVGRYL